MPSYSFKCKSALSRLARPMYLHAGDSDAEAVQFYNTHIKVWLLGQLLMEIFLAPASFW